MSVPWYLMAKGKGGGYKTASGPIVSINDALAAPLRSLRVGIDPVQDLHGYDSPWPAGGGKNKFNVFKLTPSQDISISANGTISVTGNAKNGGQRLKNCADVVEGETYILSATTTGGANYVYLYGTNTSWYFGTQRTLTQSDLDSYVFFYGGVDTTSQISDMMIRLSSVSDASFAPYSNLCPISGRTSATVTRTGKNLLNLNESSMEALGWDRLFPIQLSAGTFTLSCQNDFGASAERLGAMIHLTDESKTDYIVRLAVLYQFGDGTHEIQFTLTEEQAEQIKYIRFCMRANGSTFSVFEDAQIMIEFSSTATDYEEYRCTTYPIPLGQTVYGGTLDVTNGVLTVDRAEVDLGSLTWKKQTSYTGKTAFQTINEIADMKPSTGNTIVQPIQCSQYKSDRWDYTLDVLAYDCRICEGWSGHAYIGICDSSCNELDGTEFKTAMSGVQLVYPLATPITIPLTPQEISTLQGQNVMWADCGPVDVEYLAAGGSDPDLMKLAVAFMGRK